MINANRFLDDHWRKYSPANKITGQTIAQIKLRWEGKGWIITCAKRAVPPEARNIDNESRGIIQQHYPVFVSCIFPILYNFYFKKMNRPFLLQLRFKWKMTTNKMDAQQMVFCFSNKYFDKQIKEALYLVTWS